MTPVAARTPPSIVRWWPPIGLTGMLLLGWAVGDGSTVIDRPFLYDGVRTVGWRTWLLFFTQPLLLVAVLVVVLTVALIRRQWRLAVAVVAAPAVALGMVRVCKPLFDRRKGGALAYPSGHATSVVVVMGMVVLVAAAARWAVVLAVAVSALGLAGQALSYHYVTDAIGGALLGSAVVCLAATFAGSRGDP